MHVLHGEKHSVSRTQIEFAVSVVTAVAASSAPSVVVVVVVIALKVYFLYPASSSQTLQ